MQNANNQGALFSRVLQNSNEPFGFDAPSNNGNYMVLYVDKTLSVNEFIQMIKSRFFANCENVELEDIWLYRICQTKHSDRFPTHKNEIL